MTTITPADEEAEEQRMYDIIRDTFVHFSHMPACDARRKSKRLRDELYAVMEDIAAGRHPAALYTDEERDAELYRALNRLCVSPVRPGAGGTRDLWTLLRVVEDICEVLAYSGKKKLADVLYERLVEDICEVLAYSGKKMTIPFARPALPPDARCEFHAPDDTDADEEVRS